MEYMTLKQYADKRGITYEAVRRMVQKYRAQLGEHIIRKNNAQLLDETAVEFLNERRRQSPVVVVRENNEDRIAELESQLAQVKAQLDQAKDRIIQLQEENTAMIEAKTKYDLLLEDHERATADLENIRGKLDQTEKQLHIAEIDKEVAQREAQSYHKSWFGFYRKTE